MLKDVPILEAAPEPKKEIAARLLLLVKAKIAMQGLYSLA
jgi:hypothetical protein